MRRHLIGLIALLLVWTAPAAAQQRPQNVILMIPDGFGPASVTMTRDYLRLEAGRSSLAFDSLQTGMVHTWAANSRVTDSAAGATAFSTGHKTNNGYVATDTLERPLATLLEGAEQRGMATGLVVTSRLTHATPATFAAHTSDRWRENEIAREELAHDVEVLFGGGRRHFLPQSEGGEREDGHHLLDEARQNGYTVVTDRTGFERVEETPVLGLFASSHMAYEIDRDPRQEPHLATMTSKALELLKDDPEGFFLMVEGSRIDHAGHNNDAAAHLHDSKAFEEAVRRALTFARREGETLVVVVSDHETGGLSLGRNRDGSGVYAWHPDVLSDVKASHGSMIRSIRSGRTPAAVLREKAGIADLSEAEQERLTQAGDWDALNAALSEIIGRRALVGWTSWGHTAVDVNVYAYGPGRDRFRGSYDNTHIGKTLADLLGLDLDALTARVRDGAATETGR